MKKVFLFFLILLFGFSNGFAAPVRGRGSAASGSRGVAVSKVASAVAPAAAKEEPKEEEVEEAAEEETKPELDVENKSSSFAERFGGDALGGAAADETPLQKSIREQKEKLGLAVKADNRAAQLKAANAKIGQDTAVECDNALRNCMATKCGGPDWPKCFLDSDTDWGMKIDSCRRNTKCTGEEFADLSVEIKADRDMNAELAGFNETLNCGKTYNNCIRDICGDDGYTKCIARGKMPADCKGFAKSYEKCWAKAGGDKAVSACEKEYKKCQTADSGLQARAMEVFATLRVELEKNIQKWEQSLYDLRERMAGMCKSGSGMFDERSLQCVYTVELFADYEGKSTQFSSKKMHGDDAYACNPDEFGIDITTFKENAYRLTRSQTAASSAALGAGAGVAVGALTSGAIGRAMDVAKTAKAAENAEDNAAAPGIDSEGEAPKTGDANKKASKTEDVKKGESKKDDANK
ncbi:MAG: hypothetical protein LBT45_02915 [Rickettsiales bacterium]|nr:hypothetical protein [Rickettsiales bacterium]